MAAEVRREPLHKLLISRHLSKEQENGAKRAKISLLFDRLRRSIHGYRKLLLIDNNDQFIIIDRLCRSIYSFLTYTAPEKVKRLTMRRVPREIHRVQEREEQRMSGTVQIEPFNAEFLTREKLHDLIFYRKSFDITNVTDISETAKRVEYAIEHQQKKLTCRVYTEYRSTAVAGSCGHQQHFWER